MTSVQKARFWRGFSQSVDRKRRQRRRRGGMAGKVAPAEHLIGRRRERGNMGIVGRERGKFSGHGRDR